MQPQKYGILVATGRIKYAAPGLYQEFRQPGGPQATGLEDYSLTQPLAPEPSPLGNGWHHTPGGPGTRFRSAANTRDSLQRTQRGAMMGSSANPLSPQTYNPAGPYAEHFSEKNQDNLGMQGILRLMQSREDPMAVTAEEGEAAARANGWVHPRELARDQAMANNAVPSEMPNFNSPASFSSLRPPSNPAVDTTSATAPALQRLFQPASAAQMPRAGDARPAWLQQSPPPRNPMAVRPPAAASAPQPQQTPQQRPQQQTVSAFNQLPQDFQQRFNARHQSGQNAAHMDQQYAVNYYNQHYVNSEKPQQAAQSPQAPASPPPIPMAPQPRYGEGSRDDIRHSVVQDKLQSNPGMSPEDQAAFQYAGHVDRMSTNEARRQQTVGDYGRGRGVDNIGRSPAQWGRLAAADAARRSKPIASTGGNVILDTNPSRPRPSTEELASRRQAYLAREQAIKDTRRNSRQQRRLMLASR